MKMSIIYTTAREEYPLIDLPNVSHIKIFLDCLTRQTFKDFEVIISDALYKKRIEMMEKKELSYDFSSYPFPIRHIDPNEFSWALKKGLWGVQDGINYGIIHSDGELLLWYPDCCELVNNDSLQLWWDWYQKGYFAQALFVFYKGGKPLMVNDAANEGIVSGGEHNQPIDKIRESYKLMVELNYLKDIVRDHRWKYVEENKNGPGLFYPIGQQFFGYTSFSMDAALRLNGYDSNLDGQKSLTDVEFGMRLEKAGFQFVCDKNLWLVEHSQYPVSKDVLFGMPLKSWKSNYSIIMLNDAKKKITANDYKLTPEELEWIVAHGAKWDNPRLSPGCKEYDLLMDWYNNPPIYNLRELRNKRLREEGKTHLIK